MATTEELEKEILAEMAADPVAYSAGPVDDVITIDGETRVISVPASEILFGVETDKDVERKHFMCPKIVGDGIDLSKHQIYISYITSDSTGKSFSGDSNLYLCEDVAVDGDDITFSWQLSGNVFANAGFIAFKVLAAKTDGENVQTRWNTVPAVGTVLMTVPDGMDISETYPDIVTQLLERMESVEKIATEEAMQGYVNTYLEAHPADIDETLTDPKKAAPASVAGELKEDLGDLSIGNYIIRPKYHSGKIDPSSGEEVTPYDTARISEKLNFDNYESVIVGTIASEDSSYWLYISVFEFDSSGKYIKQIANTLDKYTITPTNSHLYVLQWWYGGSDAFENRLPYTKVSAKSLLNKKDKEQIYADLSAKTEAKLDLPDKLFIVKGETLELFKYGMYYTDTEFINNQYNVRVVNIDKYATEYDDKIVISCPDNYSKPILQGDYDLALFQLINTYGKVIEQKRVKIFVADKAAISDIDRNIMYLGDSFTGMGFRTQEIANLIAKESNLTKTKLIGRSIGQGSGNRFTGTGGYSWANYTENPNTLPSAYPNNYLWDSAYNHISMYYLVNSLGENHLDYVVILLGWNDYENGVFASSFDWDIMKQRAKRLIENIHNSYPACKIILESYHYMYPLHRKSYGSALPQVRQNKYIYDLNRFYQEIANEYEYVEFVQMSIQIDVLHNMGFEEEKANKRSEEIVKYCKDVVHPADIGFYQYSDAEFNALLYLMQ